MKNLAKLKKASAEKLESLNSIIETRGENMDQESLDKIKSIKSEIEMIDNSITAIEEVRSIVSKQGFKVTEVDEKETELRAAFDDFLRCRIDDKEYEERIMQSGGTGAGAELVPEEFFKVLQETILDFSNFLEDTQIITTADNGALTIPLMDDTANSGAWIEEGGTIPLADAATDQRTMNAYKEGSGILISTELIEDSFFDLQSWVAKALAIRLARTYNAAFINGDGASKPLGILNDPSTISVPTVTTSVTDWEDAVNLRYALQPSLRVGGVYYASDEMMKQMEIWVDESGRPLMISQAGSTPADPIRFAFNGYPVKLNTELGLPTVPGDSPLIFGNARNYWVRMTRAVQMKRNDYSHMDTDEVAFYATTRLDGKLANENGYFAKLEVTGA